MHRHASILCRVLRVLLACYWSRSPRWRGSGGMEAAEVVGQRLEARRDRPELRNAETMYRSNPKLAAIASCLAFAALAHGHGGWANGYPGGAGGFPTSYPGGRPGTGDSGTGGSSGFPGAGFGGFAGFDIGLAMHYRTIHGILAALAMVVLFPLGSILMRILPGRLGLWIHGIFQLLAFAVFIAGVGLGIYLVRTVQIPFGGGNLLTNSATNYHPIIGIVTLALLLPQPILGYIHHRRFKKLQKRQAWSYAHIFNGRFTVTLGIINGGLGLYLAGASTYYKRVYAIVAAIMWSLWMLIALWSEIRRMRRNRKIERDAQVQIAKGVARDGRKSEE
ncbi:hypothetical protein B0T17DRAFT_519367 [Bombardia bombarda]|uniref:Cytochrome b561 domain-containing protein n=1 Tax=Bombardia bombarda TaxID=252184 RepID=A0AA39XM34_9PEZI|nr:hypothetical protein B0T17DRAFT_519367 [Bombardia bombarda]